LHDIGAHEDEVEGSPLQHRQPILAAGPELEDALTGFLPAQHQATHLEHADVGANRAVELPQMQSEPRRFRCNRVYNGQTARLSAQDNGATTRGNVDLQVIQVYKALGGGWFCFLDGCGIPGSDTPPANGLPAAPSTPQPTTPAPAPIPAPDDKPVG